MSKAKQNKHGKIEVVRLPQALVFNPKVEQVVRAIYFGYDTLSSPNALVASPTKGTALDYFGPDATVVIGVADARGYRFKPESNSALISLGYNPTAVLLWLTQMRVNGDAVVQAHEDELLAVHAAMVQCARDVVFNYEKLGIVQGKPKTVRGKVQPARSKIGVISQPILENYRKHGKPALFA